MLCCFTVNYINKTLLAIIKHITVDLVKKTKQFSLLIYNIFRVTVENQKKETEIKLFPICGSKK